MLGDGLQLGAAFNRTIEELKLDKWAHHFRNHATTFNRTIEELKYENN